MAYDSTQRTRIIPAIPLKFGKKAQDEASSTRPTSAQDTSASSRPDVEHKGLVGQQAAPPPANAPLTPESIPSVPAHNGADYKDTQNNNEDIAANTFHPTMKAPVNGTLPTTSVYQHEQSNRQQVFADQESNGYHVGHTRAEADLEGSLPPLPASADADRSDPSQPSPTYKQEGAHQAFNAGALVFGSVAHETGTTAVTFTSPRRHGHSSRNSIMANNINAAPFFPAQPPPYNPELHNPTTYTPVDAPPFQPFSPIEPWYPETFQFPATPHFSQPMSPTLSQRSSTRNGQRTSAVPDSLLNGHDADSPPPSLLPTPVDQFRPTELRTQEQEKISTLAIPLNDYVLSQFGQLSYADCLLEFYLPETTFAPVRFPAHRLLAARSPRLASELVLGSPAAEFDPFGLRIVRVWVRSRHVRPNGLTDALRCLYGAPLPRYTPPGVTDQISTSALTADFFECLGLAAAGTLLELPEVETHGLAMAKKLVSWDNVEKVQAYLAEADESRATKTLQAASIEFLAKNFPRDFIFDSRAPQLVSAPRLPEIASSRPSTADARLSQIQFGDVETTGSQADHQALVSSLLLSLPFDALKALFDHEQLRDQVGASNLGHLQQVIIDERERRRVKVARSRRRSGAPAEQQDPALADNLTWVESLDRSFDGSLILSRARKDAI